MFERLKKLLGVRSYDGAAGGRRWRGQPSMAAPISATQAARGTLAARARYAVSNNPLASAAVQTWCAQAIGSGIKASSLHGEPTIREALTANFAAWTDIADDEGRTDWFGVQMALFRSMVITGEGLALMINGRDGLRVRVLDPEQLDASYTANLDGGGRAISGVEFNSDGQRIAYHIYDFPAGLDFSISRHRRRIPAEDVLHCYRQDWPGMVRGVSWLAPAMLRLSDLDGWSDAMLMKLKTSSLLTGFVTSSDGTGKPFEGEQSGSTLVGGLEPATIKYFEFSQPANVGSEAIQFSVVCERHIAASLGLPAHVFGDVTQANYSSLKTANTAWKARVEAVQWHVFIFQVCLPVWRRWVATEVLSGRVQTTVAKAMLAKHHTPSWPSLEPVKEATAAIMELRAGLTTQRALLAAKGEDLDQVFREVADDNAKAAELGLAFPALIAANDNQPAATDEAA
jgi:lambda family phage portal protein